MKKLSVILVCCFLSLNFLKLLFEAKSKRRGNIRSNNLMIHNYSSSRCCWGKKRPWLLACWPFRQNCPTARVLPRHFPLRSLPEVRSISNMESQERLISGRCFSTSSVRGTNARNKTMCSGKDCVFLESRRMSQEKPLWYQYSSTNT